MRFHVLTATIAAALPVASVIAAQDSPIQRGAMTVAGTAQFSRFRDIGNDNAWTTFELAPRLGFFVVRGLAVSANLRFHRNSGDTFRETGWGVGPGLTYYFSGVSPKVFPFVSGRTLYTWSNANVAGPFSRTDKRTDWSWLASAGLLVMLGDHVGLSGEAYYQRSRFTASLSTQPGEFVNRSEQYGLQWGIAAFIF